MTNLKSSLISSGIVILLSANLYAAEIFTVQNMSLKDALEKISKESKLSYMVDESLIKGKLSPNITNMTNIQKLTI